LCFPAASAILLGEPKVFNLPSLEYSVPHIDAFPYTFPLASLPPSLDSHQLSALLSSFWGGSGRTDTITLRREWDQMVGRGARRPGSTPSLKEFSTFPYSVLYLTPLSSTFSPDFQRQNSISDPHQNFYPPRHSIAVPPGISPP